jgi:hypothetical protein
MKFCRSNSNTFPRLKRDNGVVLPHRSIIPSMHEYIRVPETNHWGIIPVHSGEAAVFFSRTAFFSGMATRRYSSKNTARAKPFELLAIQMHPSYAQGQKP